MIANVMCSCTQCVHAHTVFANMLSSCTGAPRQFWLRALLAGDVGSQAVHARDHAALGHLTDVRVVRSGDDATAGFTFKGESVPCLLTYRVGHVRFVLFAVLNHCM